MAHLLAENISQFVAMRVPPRVRAPLTDMVEDQPAMGSCETLQCGAGQSGLKDARSKGMSRGLWGRAATPPPCLTSTGLGTGLTTPFWSWWATCP